MPPLGLPQRLTDGARLRWLTGLYEHFNIAARSLRPRLVLLSGLICTAEELLHLDTERIGLLAAGRHRAFIGLRRLRLLHDGRFRTIRAGRFVGVD